jgi:hypothetical protein
VRGVGVNIFFRSNDSKKFSIGVTNIKLILSSSMIMVIMMMNNGLFLRRILSPEMLRRVPFVRTDVWEELSACTIRVTRIFELGTELATI